MSKKLPINMIKNTEKTSATT